jgi:hypothetical protein
MIARMHSPKPPELVGSREYNRLLATINNYNRRSRCPLKRACITLVFLVSAFAQVGYTQDCQVSTTVRVLDKRGLPVVNLTADQLSAEIDGTPVKIRSISPGNNQRIVLLLDVSSSMKTVWSPSIAAAKQSMEGAGENFDIVLFRDTIRGHARGRSQSERLLEQLSPDALQPGGTALYDSLIEVANSLKTPNAAIVVVSDGGENASTHSSDATVPLLIRASSPSVFALILDFDRENAHSRGYFKKIPADTGGLIEYPPSSSKVPEATANLMATVRNPLVVTLQPSQPITKMAKLKLEAINSNGKPQRDMRVLHVAEVASCDVR